MIKLRDLICEIIAERMSYADLMSVSDPNRKDRAKRIPAKSLVVRADDDREAWKFSYKTPKDESTTGLRHQGFIHFFKDDINSGDNAMQIDCSVDCSCPDYKYRWAYNNARAGAGELGAGALNRNNGAAPKINLGEGLCKHLLSLKEYLKTKIDGEPVQPPDAQKGVSVDPVVHPASPPPEKVPAEDPVDVEPEEIPVDPTQSPDVDVGLQDEPEQPVEDPTQTPQEPEIDPDVKTQEDPPIDDPNTQQNNPDKKLKENITDKSKIIKILDSLCRNKNVFIV